MADTVLLIGFMGAGKTTIGHRLAQVTEQKFLDLDDEFVKKTNSSINDFMEKNGEEAFRQMETTVLKDSLKNPGIISSGGGIVESKTNLDAIKNTACKVIFLQADFATILQRLASDTDRPLLRQLSMHDLLNRWEFRQPLYEQISDSIIATNGKSPEKIVNELTDMLDLADNSLVSLRSEIDSFDRQILNLISKRIDIVKQVADVKKIHGISVIQNNRMQQIRFELKNEFKQDANVSDELIDDLVDLLTTNAIDNERKMIG